MRFIKKYFFLTIISIALMFPNVAKAFSVQQQIILPASSFISSIGEKIQYVFAFTPDKKAIVLENQAQKRLLTAQNNPEQAEDAISEYQDIKNKQSSLLDRVGDNTLNEVKERTRVEQQTMVEIGNNNPTTVDQIKAVNVVVVSNVKNAVTYKEGTSAGENFEQGAAIIYAPGTSAGGEAGHTYEGGALQIYAPGTSGTGPGGVVIEGGTNQYAPGTSGGGDNAGADIQNTVIEGNAQ